ncbi:MAG: UDP-N-acetylmuramoyl-L-alanyl-D-glutamate--2,6-diaminopimelate ligase [Firmicutes bacterium]|nr:UDP-N-acetylmuramoyl-L-alanyl-D-glutamate--2,6-diaminopimelate ligase [Bacillota bacterium]
MKLTELLVGLESEKVVGDIGKIQVKGLANDTRNIKKGFLYFCLSGYSVDGHGFAEEAVGQGAVALVVERVLEVDCPQILVKNSRIAMAEIAAAFNGRPAEKLKFITVTGTNGKTSTTYFISSILESAGKSVGVIGTTGNVINGIKQSGTLTTPDPIELHALLKKMLESGVEVVAMEASAHAITLNKLHGIQADVAILTNITQDHLDFYGSMEKYAEAKLSYFTPAYAKTCVVNVDDEYGRKLLAGAGIPVYTYGLENPAGVFAVNCMFSTGGTDYFLNLFDELININTKMLGKFNLYNALAAAAACKVFGAAPETVAKGLREMEPVEGRFNVINLPNKTSVIIDYAHTPDSLSNILGAVRGICKGRIISVFGCGGNRDSIKRPTMGKISCALADFTVITSDNPRFEEPEEIIAQVEQGAKQVSENYICITDRVEAIAYGLKNLQPGDCMVLSGKGSEDYMDVMGVKRRYSDFEAVEKQYGKFPFSEGVDAAER